MTTRKSKQQARFPRTILAFIKHFFKPYHLYLITMLIINISVALYISLQPYVLKKLIDAAIPALGSAMLIQVTLLPALLLVGLTIFNNAAWRLNNYITMKALPKLKADIIDQASDYTHGQSYKFFQNNLSGGISNRISDLANNTDSLITNGRSLLQSSLVIISAIVIAGFVNPIFSMLFFIWTIFFLIAGMYFSYAIEPFSKSFAQSRSHAVGNVVDSFVNAVNVILFSNKKFEHQYLRHSLNTMVHKDTAMQARLMKYAFIMSGFTISIQAIAIALLLYFGQRGMITAGDFALIFLLTLSVLDEIWNFTELLFRVAEQLGVFNQALQFISSPYEISDHGLARPIHVNTGEIEFKKVVFYYDKQDTLFENKTLTIRGREKVGLVGHSGSGKSSFVNLITRLFDIQSGDITIDGQSIYQVSLESLREHITYIPQDPSLFHRSIMDNIRYGKLDASDEEVIAAAKKAHVHEFVEKLTESYQTLVGERGVKLSGGQRQRVAIARAILKDSPIFILDEATSALDSVTESLIHESLKVAMQNKTVIVIAHRLSTIKAMDRILVFENGRIVEEGTHESLLKTCSLYNKLWDMQKGILAN